jgi:hypothetical protein
VIEAPAIAISHLPDLDVHEDETNQLSLLQKMLLTKELAYEPPDPWSYRQFIHQFAHSDPSHDTMDGEDDYSIADEDEVEYD